MNVRTQDVLKVLGITSLVVASTIFPKLPTALVSTYRGWKKFKQRDLGKIIKRLEKQKLVAIREEGNQIIMEITEKGKRRLLEYDFENIQIETRKRDNKWRLVIFDIPEYKKPNRDAFRRKLVQLGMVRLQDSIFVSAFPCKQEIDFLCHFLEISDFVTLLTVDKIERGEHLIFKQYTNWDNDTLYS